MQYAYITNKGDKECKIRGFTLNAAASEKLNFESMLQLVENPGADAIVTREPGAIGKHKHTHTVYSYERKKRYRCVNDKRVYSADQRTSKPYGWWHCDEPTYVVDEDMNNVYPLREVAIDAV